MSKDIIVLTPNGRRQKVHCTPDTSILQVLEDVCHKQGFQPSDYDLKHHNHVLDLTTTVRFSNLPNKAMLEMVEADKKREETNVTIGLLLENGERRTADFAPTICLYELVTSLAPTELKKLNKPTISYMRQEVIGEPALKEKSLRQLGLIKGRAILRLLNKADVPTQANVSSVYRKPSNEIPKESDVNFTSKMETKAQSPPIVEEISMPGPSNDIKSFDPIKMIKLEKQANQEVHMDVDPSDTVIEYNNQIENKQISDSSSHLSISIQENLERRLKIEEEVTFIGTQKAIAFTQPDGIEKEFEDLPDDFYDLTIEEVRRLYHDLQQNRHKLENSPLVTCTKRQEMESQTSQQRLSMYKNVVVRVQFPDNIILQGIFSPNDTIEDVNNFVRNHLSNSNKSFQIFTTPLKEALDTKQTLLEAKFVPCVHMHFKWLDENQELPYLKEEVYLNQTSSDAASILASKYRAPSRKNLEGTANNTNAGAASTSKNSKVPNWFKNK